MRAETYQSDESANARPATRTLMVCGMVAGPLYVATTLAQALTRTGFDMKQHRFSLLTVGEFGWIHQLNMVMVGTLTVLLAIGASRVLRAGGTFGAGRTLHAGRGLHAGRSAVWAPRLLALVGAAYLFGGLLTSDPAIGFPPGTNAELLQRSWQGVAQNASRGVSSLLLVATSMAIAIWFAAAGRKGWAWFYAAAIPVVFATLTAVGLLIGGNPVALAFLMTPWIWVTALATHLYMRDAHHSNANAVGTPKKRS